MADELNAVTFKAHFARFATQADGAVRVSFDIAPYEARAVVDLLALKEHVLQVACVPIANESITQTIRGPW